MQSTATTLNPTNIVYVAKRAETRECPVCKELIPIRLLAAHAVLETRRVEEIIDSVGSTDVLLDEHEEGCVYHYKDASKILLLIVRVSQI